ncbi:hypothetical protein LINGRAHAP2_LOCUS28198, partial [Linum grandiflorum]
MMSPQPQAYAFNRIRRVDDYKKETKGQEYSSQLGRVESPTEPSLVGKRVNYSADDPPANT